MPQFQYTEEEVPSFEHLTGEYPFEVLAVDFGTQSNGKTRGLDTMELKLAFYADETFQRKVGQFTDNLTFPGLVAAARESGREPKEEEINLDAFLAGRINMFVKSSNLLINGEPPRKGDPVDFNDHMVVGLRGWSRCEPRASKTDATKKYNSVKEYLTNKPRLPKHVDLPPEEDPFSE